MLNRVPTDRPVGQVVKTPPFHGGNMGSNPVRVIVYRGQFADLAQLVEHRYRKPRVSRSNRLVGTDDTAFRDVERFFYCQNM